MKIHVFLAVGALLLAAPVDAGAGPKSNSPGKSGIDLGETRYSNAGRGNGSEWSRDTKGNFKTEADGKENDPAKSPLGRVEVDPGKSGARNANNRDDR